VSSPPNSSRLLKKAYCPLIRTQTKVCATCYQQLSGGRWHRLRPVKTSFSGLLVGRDGEVPLTWDDAPGYSRLSVQDGRMTGRYALAKNGNRVRFSIADQT
jgi:hypothetical protein